MKSPTYNMYMTAISQSIHNILVHYYKYTYLSWNYGGYLRFEEINEETGLLNQRSTCGQCNNVYKQLLWKLKAIN